MKRHRQAIQVGHKNITDIMRLPCVLGCRKQTQEPLTVSYVLFGDTEARHVRWGEPVTANEGDWLVEDTTGRWHVLTDKDWQKRSE